MAGFDPWLGAVSSLLHFDGANGATSFPDSARGKAFTAAGSAKLSTAAAKFGTASAATAGGSDGISTPNHPDFQFGTGDFALEGWINFAGLPAPGTVVVPFSRWTTVAGQESFNVQVGNTSGTYYIALGLYGLPSNLGVSGNFPTAPSINTWYHIATTRVAGIGYVFINGSLINSAALGTDITVGTAPFMVPSNTYNNWAINGRLDDVRVTKGVGRYTATFPVPTEAYPDSGTVMLLNMNGTDASTSIVDAEGHTMTAVGNAKLSTAEKKFGTASLILDGAGDYVTTPDSLNYAFGAGDFTIETWIRPTAMGDAFVLAQQDTAVTNCSFSVAVSGTGSLSFTYTANGTTPVTVASATGVIVANTWQFVSVSRVADQLYVHANGVLVAQSTIGITALFDSTSALLIGAAGSTPSGFFTGYVDDLRIIKGMGRYGSATYATPPIGLTVFPDTFSTASLAIPAPTLVMGDVGMSLSASMPVLETSSTSVELAIPSPLLVTALVNSSYNTVALTAPLPLLSAVGFSGTLITFDQTAPMPQIEIGTKDFVETAPMPVLVATVLSGSVIAATLVAPLPTLDATLLNPAIITADNAVPMPQLTAFIASGNTLAASLLAAMPTLSAQGFTGNVATVVITAPAPVLEAIGYPEYTITFEATAPMPRLDAILSAAVATAYRTWALNLRRGALTEYDFAFNSYTIFNGVVLAAGPNGLFALGNEDTDAGVPITAHGTTAQDAFGSSVHKRVPRLYLGYDTTGDMLFRVITTEGGARTYSLADNGVRGIQQRRVPIGKGVKSSRFQFGFENVNGADFSIQNMFAYPTKLRRRVM